MTIWYVDIMWALMLLGVALWTGCLLVFNPVMKSIRVMGMIAAYGIGVWMAITLPWLVALVTWCMFAAFGGAVALVYEVWARRRYADTGRANRPLVLFEGFLLWPVLVPDVVEGVLVDAGVLEASSRGGGRALPDRPADP
jgi:hypothetical protein